MRSEPWRTKYRTKLGDLKGRKPSRRTATYFSPLSRRYVYSHVVNAMPILSRPHSGLSMQSRLFLPTGTARLPGPVLAQRRALLPGTRSRRVLDSLSSILHFSVLLASFRSHLELINSE